MSAPITIGITVTFMFHRFFSSLFSLSFSFTLWSAGAAKSTIRLLRLDDPFCIAKSQRILCVSFSRTDSGLCIYHIFIWLNLKFLHSSQWITFHNQSCLVLHSLCISLLHSLIIRLILSAGESSLLFFLDTYVNVNVVSGMQCLMHGHEFSCSFIEIQS